jgi:hypothetical protein
MTKPKPQCKAVVAFVSFMTAQGTLVRLEITDPAEAAKWSAAINRRYRKHPGYHHCTAKEFNEALRSLLPLPWHML